MRRESDESGKRGKLFMKTRHRMHDRLWQGLCGAQAQIVFEARTVLKKERDDDCGEGESWGECALRSKRRPLGRHRLFTAFANEAS